MSAGPTRRPLLPARAGWLRRLVVLPVAAYLSFCLMLLLLQSRLVFFPTRPLESTPDQAGLAYEDVWLHAEDGVRLHGWWVPAPRAQGVVLFFHGNAGNISHRLPSLETFHRLGYSTLIFDYRGYGRSEGRPSERGAYLDAEAAWLHLTADRGVEADRIILFGRSLGGAVAASLAQRYRPAALILESTFTSVPALGAELYPFLPVRLLARIQFDTLERMQSIRSPVLVVHSRGDEIIPFRHGLRLWEAAREPKRFLEISGGHNDGFWTSGVRYEQGLQDFLRAHVDGRGPSAR